MSINGTPTGIFTDSTRARMAQYVRAKLDDNTKEAILLMAEEVMAEIVEQEMSDLIEPKFEQLYESVVAAVLQKQLMKALAQRAQAHAASLTT